MDGDLSPDDPKAQVSPMAKVEASTVWWGFEEKVGDASLTIPRVLAKATPDELTAHPGAPHSWIQNLVDANKKSLDECS